MISTLLIGVVSVSLLGYGYRRITRAPYRVKLLQSVHAEKDGIRYPCIEIIVGRPCRANPLIIDRLYTSNLDSLNEEIAEAKEQAIALNVANGFKTPKRLVR